MVVDYVTYEVVFTYGEVNLSVVVKDIEGMDEDGIVTEAQVIMQEEDLEFDTEKIELVSCLVIK